MGRRKAPDLAAIEAHRALVAAGVLARRSVRRIAADLARGVPCGACEACEERGACGQRVPVADCAPSTIGRDVQALRAEWAKVRMEKVDQLIGEEVARLNALEDGLWARAVAGNTEAVDRVVAIQRERVRLLRLAPSGGGIVPELPSGGAARVQVTVEYVDDWRAARSGWLLTGEYSQPNSETRLLESG